MKSWEKGKIELRNEISRICAVIDQDIRKEIHDSSSVKIEKEELRVLREKSSQNEKLIQDYKNSIEELEKYKLIASQANILRRENEILRNELDHKSRLFSNQDPHRPEYISGAPPKTINLDLLSDGVVQEEYQRLVKKNDILQKNCNQLKEAWVKMEGKLREQKKKNMKWASHIQQKDEVIKKKALKIKELEQTAKNLKAKLGEEVNNVKVSSETTFKPSLPASNAKEKPLQISFSQDHLDTSAVSSIPENSLFSGSDNDLQVLSSSYINREISSGNYCTEAPNLTPESLKVFVDNSKHEVYKISRTGKKETTPEALVQKHKTANQSIIEEPSIRPPISHGKLSTINIYRQRAMKRKERHESREKCTKNKPEIITSSPNGIHGLLNLNDSIDLDEIGLKFNTPRKHRFCLSSSRECGTPSPVFVEPKRPRRNGSSASFKELNKINVSQAPTSFSNLLIHNGTPINQNFKPKNGVREICKQLHSKTDQVISRALDNHEDDSFIGNDSSPDIQICSDTISCKINEESKKNESPVSLRSFQDEDFSESKMQLSKEVLKDMEKTVSLSLDCSNIDLTGFFKQNPRKDFPDHTSISAHLPQKKVRELNNSPKISEAHPVEPPKHSSWQLSSDKSSISGKKITSREGSLRTRPIEKLRIWDFKVNPQYNQGYQYAFSEVVRGHARSGLKGCLKPCCEPKYRALAEISRNPNKTPTLSQQEADQLMLEEFMGDNAYKLLNMSGVEKDELIILAKTRDLANKHGNHRHLYENPETPVGLWRADFPTTQEAIEEEKKVEERTRKIVEKRYAEAMRPGGAYKFRDE